MEERIARLEGLVEGMRNELNHLRNDFRTLLWIQIGSWVTLMAAIIATRFQPATYHNSYSVLKTCF